MRKRLSIAVTSWVSATAPTSVDRETSAAVLCLGRVVVNALARDVREVVLAAERAFLTAFSIVDGKWRGKGA